MCPAGNLHEFFGQGGRVEYVRLFRPALSRRAAGGDGGGTGEMRQREEGAEGGTRFSNAPASSSEAACRCRSFSDTLASVPAVASSSSIVLSESRASSGRCGSAPATCSLSNWGSGRCLEGPTQEARPRAAPGAQRVRSGGAASSGAPPSRSPILRYS